MVDLTVNARIEEIWMGERWNGFIDTKWTQTVLIFVGEA